MVAYRLGNVAFVLHEGKRVLKVKFPNSEAAAEAVLHFNAGKHSTLR